MNATISIDTREFQQAVREYLLTTTRELSKALNARLFFLFVRLFAILPPKNPKAKREQIRASLTRTVGERRVDKSTGKFVGRGRELRSVHLIVQSRRKKAGQKGLYGADMKKSSAALLRRSVGSVGYLKSGIVRVLRGLNGHFSQFGSTFSAGRRKGSEGYSRSNPRQVGGVNVAINKQEKTQANAALVKIGAEYGVNALGGNVAVHKGSKGRAIPAKPGFNPVATGMLTIGIANGQLGRVEAIFNPAMQRAINDELAEMQRHMAAKAQEVADQFNA